MKLLDLAKCHEDSLGFRRNLEAFEEATVQLEKTLKRICSICEKRAELAQRDSELTNDLVAEMEFFTHNDLAGENEISVGNPMEMLTTSLRQLADNQERLFEQIDLALVKPMKHFLHNDVEQVKTSRKAYRKLHAEAVHLEEKICQCKRYEAGLMNELSYQLFDTRFQLHRAACEYVLDLNALHSKKTPDFLQRVVDLMTSYFSYHHIGSVTTKESHPVVEGLYQTLENLRKQCTAEDTQRRTQVQTLLQEVFLSRTEDLLVFHQNDLQVPSEVAKGNVRQHLAANYSDVSYAPKEVAFPDVQTSQSRSKSGYLMYLEQKTFGNAWIRLFFTAKRGKLEAPENKAKIPIGLNLKLCQVKPALPSDSERNFCFKVISPTRQLLLQTQSSKDMQEWIEVLTNAITYSLHHQRPSLSLEEQELLSPTDDLTSSPTSITGSPTLPPSPNRNKDKPKTGSAILRELQSIPGNELCADCFVEKPKWASVNLGVLICIDCSGVHRSLGVHISQVRSLTLDTVKPEWEERLRMIGNNRANEIYEEMLPEEFSREPIQKDESRSQFIMNKYKEMKYCSEANRLKIKEEREQSRTKSLQKAALASLQSPPPAPAPVTVVTTMGNGRERRIETEVEHTQGIVLASGSVNAKHKKPSHPPQRPESPSGSLVVSGSGSGMLQKMTKSLGTMKETVVKFAKNDL